MLVTIEGCWAGRDINIKATGNGSTITSVQINGYIETPRLRFHYLRSSFRIIKDGFLTVKLPSILLPSYECGPYKIWYECVVIAKGGDGDVNFRKLIVIHNNNLLDFSNEVLITLSMESPDYSAYYLAKKIVAGKLFKSIVGDDSVLSVTGDDPVLSVIGDDPEVSGALKNIDQTLCFDKPSILLIEGREIRRSLFSGKTKIGVLYYHEVLKYNFSIRIQYLTNVYTTVIHITRYFLEKDCLQNVQVLFNRAFLTDGCVEHVFPLELDGGSLRTFLFEVKHVLSIGLDGVEVIFPISIATPNIIVKEIEV
ncbi:hypothetical protein PAEPH01_0040 [Pancytospora epiphaga]|nr:hypothetical protein PAEPH01_0040 [Pancytospora epiphaga]